MLFQPQESLKFFSIASVCFIKINGILSATMLSFFQQKSRNHIWNQL